MARGAAKIGPDEVDSGSFGAPKPKIGLLLLLVPACCVLSGGSKLKGAGTGVVAATGLDAPGSILTC